MEHDSSSPGFLGTLRQMVDTVLKLLQNRIELFAVEFQEEKFRTIELLVLVAFGIFFGMMTLLMVTMTIIFAFQEHALAMFGLFSAIYLVGLIILVLTIKRRLKDSSAPFAGTIEQLKKDREWTHPES